MISEQINILYEMNEQNTLPLILSRWAISFLLCLLEVLNSYIKDTQSEFNLKFDPAKKKKNFKFLILLILELSHLI